MVISVSCDCKGEGRLIIILLNEERLLIDWHDLKQGAVTPLHMLEDAVTSSQCTIVFESAVTPSYVLLCVRICFDCKDLICCAAKSAKEEKGFWLKRWKLIRKDWFVLRR